MESVNIVIDEFSEYSSEKFSEEIPKEILPPKPKDIQEIVDQEPVGKSGFVSHTKHIAEATNMDLFHS